MDSAKLPSYTAALPQAGQGSAGVLTARREWRPRLRLSFGVGEPAEGPQNRVNRETQAKGQGQAEVWPWGTFVTISSYRVSEPEW